MRIRQQLEMDGECTSTVWSRYAIRYWLRHSQDVVCRLAAGWYIITRLFTLEDLSMPNLGLCALTKWLSVT